MLQAYNYMLGSFPVNKEVMYPANKRSDLRRVYCSIVNLSKHMPYYKIDLSMENQKFAFGVKETALILKENLKNILEDRNSIFQSKAVKVNDETILTAQLLNEDTQNLPDIIRIKVNSLASSQVNRGKDLLYVSNALIPGKYNFTAKIADETYQLTYVQNERTSNRQALEKLADFLNQSLPGLTVSAQTGDNEDYGYIRIASDFTGTFGDRAFSFEDNEDFKVGLVDFFDLNHMDEAPQNARVELNGIEKQTVSNSFTLENSLKISLYDQSEKPVTLRITHDSNKILSMVDTVLSIYNSIIGLANERQYEDNGNYLAMKLVNEMKSLTKIYDEELAACGMKAREDGTLTTDDSLAVMAAEDGGMESLMKRENGFIARLMDKAEAIAINPMEYLEKTIIFYADTGITAYRNPYVTSMYSGLFFNSYC